MVGNVKCRKKTEERMQEEKTIKVRMRGAVFDNCRLSFYRHIALVRRLSVAVALN